MESWAVKLESGQSLDVPVGQGKYLYLTQASLGESKKETKKSACLQITIDDKKHVLGTLHPKRLPQQDFDLVFDRDFQISHNWRNGSVHFSGYTDKQPGYKHGVSEDDTNSDDDEQSGRKRPKAAASKTPSTNKKAKKSEGKKGGVATPRPSKQAAAKKPAGGNKSNQKFPASDDAHILKPRKRHK